MASRRQKVQQNPAFIAYRYAVAPILAFLPSKLAYRLALFFGAVRYEFSPQSREKIVMNLEWVSLGGTASKRDEIAKDFFKLRSCEAMEDLTLLRGPAPLSKLVEIRGLEHLKESIAGGGGVVLCGAHFGSFKSSLSLLGTIGYPITPLMRRPVSAGSKASPLSRAAFWVQSYALFHNMRRTNIEVQSGDPKADVMTAAMAAKYLKKNEIIYVNLDATVLPEYRARALPARFLGEDALFLTGAILIAKLTGAKVHVMLTHRDKDWMHQRLVISPPVQLDGSVEEGFLKCLSMVEQAVRLEPAHWEMWDLIPGQGTFLPNLPRL